MEDQRAATESIQDGTAAGRFAEHLRALRTAAGNPSFRKMAGRSGRISHTTLHEAAAGTRFPSWETTREFVRACEADEAQWRRRWEDAQRPAAIPDSDPSPVATDSPAEPAAPGTVDTPTTGVLAVGTLRAVDVPVAAGSVGSGVPVGRLALRAAERPRTTAGGEVTGARRQRLPWLVAAAALMAMVAVLGVIVRGRSTPAGSGPTAAPSSRFSDALIPGDSSRFVADITIPDGTRVKVNSRFVKVWALANVGSVAWHKRFLAPTDPSHEEDDCRVPDRVAIGDTPPGEQVMISVPVTASSRPGKCWVSWKMVDEHGQPYFPSRRPVYFLVTVVA